LHYFTSWSGDTAVQINEETISPGADESSVQIENILQDLHAVSTDILLSLVTTWDGLTITTHNNLSDNDDHTMAAMTSELLSVCKRSAQALESGDVNEMLLHCSKNNILLMPSGTIVVLALITKPEINLGLLLIEARRAAQAIANVF